MKQIAQRGQAHNSEDPIGAGQPPPGDGRIEALGVAAEQKLPPLRLQFLAEQIRGLGPRRLFELLTELVNGPLPSRASNGLDTLALCGAISSAPSAAINFQRSSLS